MDYLRWILLAVGIFFVLIIYFVGRNKRQHNNIYDYESEDDVPGFGANDVDDWQDLEEGVGKVRIVSREQNDYETYDEIGEDTSFITNDAEKNLEDQAIEDIDVVEQSDNKQGDNGSIIVLHLLARTSNLLAGDKINSAAQASGLRFGEMNIFHRFDEDGEPVFGMANMVEPGSFNPDTIHELETPGLTIFMQRSDSENNTVIFEDMLECAYHMSEMLGGQLCNRQRQPLSQSDAEQYRELATGFDG